MKKTRKYFAVLLALVITLTAFPLSALTASAASSGDFEYEVLSEEDKTCEITGYTGEVTELTIPSKLDGYTVTSIGSSAFTSCYTLISITIPTSVTDIGHSAFLDCTALKSINIPDGITSIRPRTFQGCTSLTNITIPNSVINICAYAFNLCSSLTSITIPDSIKGIGEFAFWDCTKLANISLPDKPIIIGASAFVGTAFYEDESNWGDSGLYIGKHFITLKEPSSYLEVREGTFSIAAGALISSDYCVNIKIPESVEAIGYKSNNSEYTSTDLHDVYSWPLAYGLYFTPEVLGNNFSDEAKITFHGYEGSYTQEYAEECGGEFISLGAVQPKFFYEVQSDVTARLTGYRGVSGSVTIPETIDNYKVTSIGSGCFSNNSYIKAVTIPDSVTNIEADAFASCSALSEIHIGSGVTNVDREAFYNCEALASFSVDSANPQYSSKDGVLFNKQQTELLQYPQGKAETDYTIPTSVNSIADYAFSPCSTLVNITIPSNVVTIGASAFEYCSSLCNVTIDNGVTRIKENAFSSCESLLNITIPSSVISIGDYAFSGCFSLTNLNLPNSITHIGNGAFEASGLISIIIPGSVECLENGIFYRCDSLENITIENGVTTIGTEAFSYCFSLENIAIPNSVVSIGEMAFENTSLKNVTFGNGLTTIGLDAFWGCPLTSVIIPSSVERIESGAFEASSLVKATILGRKTSIGDSAFNRCDDLTIYGYAGSTSESYASENNIPFSALPGMTYDIDVVADGKDVTVTITLPGSAKAAGANCTLQYDNTKLAFAKTVAQANGNMVNPNYRENAVRFSFSQPFASTTDTVMWKMEFTLKSGTVSANDFAVTAFKLYDDNAELISSEATVDTTIHFSCLHTQTAENITLQPTHTASGTKEVVCSTCGEQLQVETLPATGHTFGAWEVVRPATCTEPGEEMRRCSCGATESREIAVTEHTPGAWETELQPTCTENGKRVQKCTVCGTVLAQETVSPTGHSFGDWIVVKEATVTEEGLKERTCSVCGEKETQSIPKLEKPVITSISVSTLPDKTKYVQGETFSADGLRLQINYNNETSEIITSGFTVSAPNMETPGTKTVTVTYEGKSTSFTISVVENSVANPTAAHVYAESVKARPGETIQIPLYVESNPGVAYVKFKVAYDSNKLDLISAEDQGVFKGIYTTSQTIDVNPYVLQWMNAGNATGNGCFAILTFKVLDDATEGDITVQITYDEAYNETLDDVAFTFTSPTVAIRDYIPGDINDDGVVNGKDGILLSQYLAEWDKEINLDAADVNGDNIVNGKDSIILSQYLASWDVELGK